MKRVLFVAYLFPPIADSGAHRSLKFVKYLSEHGWQPIVLTAARSDGHATDDALLDEVPRDVHIERVPMLHEQIGGAVTAALGGGSLGRRAGDAVRRQWQARHAVPDPFAPWQSLALRAAKRLFRQIGYDAVFASGYPWSALTLGRAISAATNRPFVADFRDVWTDQGAGGDEHAHEAAHAAEADVVNGAAAVICTTDRMRQHMANTHPSIDESRFITIHNGFDADDFGGAEPAPGDGPFRIVYAGRWDERCNAGALYNAIDWIRRSDPGALEGVEVVAAGFAPGEARRRGLARHIQEIGHVAHRDAIALMRSAHLIYLDHADPERHWSVPGKLYECLATGTPVITQTHPDGEAARMLRRLGGGKTVSADDPGELYYTLLGMCRLKNVELPPLNRELLAPFERRALAAKLAAVLDDTQRREPVRIGAAPVSMPAVVLPRLRTR